MKSPAGLQAAGTSAWFRFKTWLKAGCRSTSQQRWLVIEAGRARGLGCHQLIDVRNGRNAIGHVSIVCEQARIAVGRIGMIAMHRADGALAHVAWNNEYALVDKEDHFTEIAVGEKSAQFFQFRIGENSALGDVLEDFSDLLSGPVVEEPKPGHG